MIDDLLRRWRNLSARDRRVLSWGGSLLGLVVLWAVFFDPAWSGRQRLAGDLPRLRNDAAQLDTLLADARRLGVRSGVQLRGTALQEELERSLAGSGLRGFVQKIEVTDNRYDLRFADITLPSLLGWVDSAQRALRVRPADLAFERAPGNTVNARLVLEVPAAPGGEGAPR